MSDTPSPQRSSEPSETPTVAQESGPTASSSSQSPPTPALPSGFPSPRKNPPVATSVSVNAFRDALSRVKASPKGDVKLSLDVLESYLTNIAEHPEVEKFKEIRLGNREFQWRVKKVDGAYDALLAAGFALQSEATGLLSPSSPQPTSSGSPETKAPREFLLWKADGQVDGLKECLQILKQTQAEFDERFSKFPLKTLDGKRYQKELRKEERPSSRFEIGFHDAIGRRNTMEDDMTVIGRFMSRENMDYAGIFDGHGGDQVAENCAAKMHRFIARHMTMLDDTAAAIKEAFEEMNAQCKNLPDMGATAVIALVLENRFWVANAGDARAVFSHKTEGAVRLSFDHKPDVPSEKKRIQSLGGQVFNLFGCARVNGMLAVSRAIGDASMHPFVSCEPHINSAELNSDAQFLILACDGVWDVLSDEEAVELVKKCSTATKAAQTLVQTAFEKNSTDNISVIVIFFQSPEQWAK